MTGGGAVLLAARRRTELRGGGRHKSLPACSDCRKMLRVSVSALDARATRALVATMENIAETDTEPRCRGPRVLERDVLVPGCCNIGLQVKIYDGENFTSKYLHISRKDLMFRTHFSYFLKV